MSFLGMSTLRRQIFSPRSSLLLKGLACLLLIGWTPALFASYFILYNGVVNTLATGTLGTNPSGMAGDLSGNLYIADTANNSIIKMSSSGTASTLNIASLTLTSPTALACDSAGNLYIADTGASRVVKVTTAGSFSVISTGSTTLSGPKGVAVDVSGNIYISNTGSNQIIKVSGSTASVLTATGVSLSTLNSPRGLAVDAFGNLYIADYGNSRVVKVTTGGVGSVLTGSFPLSLTGPTGIAVGRNGVIYIADSTANSVVVLDPAGTSRELLSAIGYSTTFTGPTNVAVSSDGAVYVEDSGGSSSSGRVQSVRPTTADFGHVALGSSNHLVLPFSVGIEDTITARVVYTAGTQNVDFTIANDSTCIIGTAGNGSDPTPCNLDVTFTPTYAGLRRGAVVITTSSGNITVPIFGYADAPVAALSPGIASTIKNNGTTIPVQGPFQTAVDGAGNMYVAGYNSSVVTKIPAGGGTPTTVSTGSYPLSSPGPTGIAIDAANNLFIADYSNNRIVEVDSHGIASELNIQGLPATTVGGVTDILHAPTSLAFDQAGNLFITDYGSGRIIEVTPSLAYSDGQAGAGTIANGTGYAVGTVGVSFGFTTVTGSTIDPNGNIYVANRGASPPTIVKIDPLGTISTVSLGSVSALSGPFGITSDPLGNLYVMDSGSVRIVEVTSTGTASVMKFSGPSLNINIFGLYADGNGNVLVSDFQNNRLVSINVGQSALTFPNTNVSATSSAASPSAAYITNLGNQSLIFSANPTYTSNFSEIITDTNPCTSDTSLTTGSSCKVPIQFSPQVPGSLSANISVTDNNLNIAGSTQQIAASGTAINPAHSTQSAITFSPSSGTYSYGQSVSITVTVTDLTTPSSLPAGTVTCTDSVNSGTPSTLNATPASLVAGTVTLPSVVLLGVGTNSITCTFTPTNSNSYSTSNKNTSITVSKTANVLTASSSSISLSAGQSGSVTVTATPTYTGGTTPSGSVSYSILNSSNASAYSGTAVLVAGSGKSTAALSIPATLSPGSYTVSITYAGDTNYSSATTLTVPLTIGQITPTITWSPSGSITYGTTLSALLSATASSGSTTIPGTFAYTATLSGGSATTVTGTTILSAGTYTLTANFTPTDKTTYANKSSAVSLVVGKSSSTTTLVSSVNPTYVTTAVTLTATASSSISTPTGSVSFMDGSTLLSTVALSQGKAAYTTSSLATGTHSITAVYSGDTNFSTSTSTAVAELIQDFTVSEPSSTTTNTPSATVTPGGTATYTLNIGPSAGTVFPAPVTLSLSGLPAGATGSLSPSTLPAGSSLTAVSLTIKLPQTAELNSRPHNLRLAVTALALLLLPFAGKMRRTAKGMQKFVCLMILFAGSIGALVGLSGCGAKASGYFGDPVKSYTIYIIATSGSLSHSTAVTLTVQ